MPPLPWPARLAAVALLASSPRAVAGAPAWSSTLPFFPSTAPLPPIPPPGCANATDPGGCAGLFALLSAVRPRSWAGAPAGCAGGWSSFLASGGAGGGVCALDGVGCTAAGRVTSLTLVPGCGLAVAALPAGLAVATGLTALELPAQHISGTLPPALFASLTALATLDLSHNFIGGALPAPCALRSLTALRMRGNRLTGTLGGCWAPLTALRALDVAGNAFTGPLPEDLSYETLTYLDASYNNLRGRVPRAAANLTSAARLFLASSGLCAALPPGMRAAPADAAAPPATGAQQGLQQGLPTYDECGLLVAAAAAGAQGLAAARYYSSIQTYVFLAINTFIALLRPLATGG